VPIIDIFDQNQNLISPMIF